MIKSPFTEDQVKNLNDYQQSGVFHPFTCGNPDCREILVATKDGWFCPVENCDYTQDWAHEAMCNFDSTKIPYLR